MGDAAILLDPTNQESWSQAVRQLQRDPALRESLTLKGKKREFNTTPDDFTRELIKLFDQFAFCRRTWPSGCDEVQLMQLVAGLAPNPFGTANDPALIWHSKISSF